MIVASFRFNKEVVEQAVRAALEKTNAYNRLFYGTAVSLLALTLYLMIFAGVSLRSAAPALAVVPLLLVRPWIGKQRLRRSLQRNPSYGTTCVWKFTPETYTISSDGSESSAPLSRLYKVAECREGFLLYPQENLFSFLPFSAFPHEQDIATVRRYLSECKSKKRSESQPPPLPL